jgi:hypothetical protein
LEELALASVSFTPLEQSVTAVLLKQIIEQLGDALEGSDPVGVSAPEYCEAHVLELATLEMGDPINEVSGVICWFTCTGKTA